jgi:hypothetical protein
MLIKNIRVLFLFSLIMGSVACTKVPVYKSNWQAKEFQLMGSDEDWTGQYYYDPDAKLFYGLSNDKDNLYVRLKATDQATQRKIQVRGLTFWMDTIGKSKEQMIIRCPLPKDIEEMKKEMKKRGNKPLPNIERGKRLNDNFANGLEAIEITGFGGIPETKVLNNKNEKGVNVMMQINKEGELIWEAIIPLQLVFSNPSSYDFDANNYFSFGFVTGAFEGPSGGKMQAPGGRRPGGGRPGGGQGDGGMNQPEAADMQSMMSPSKVKVKKVNLSFE